VNERVVAARSFADSQRETSKSLTSAAICDANVLASKRVMRVTPERPARIASHAAGTPMPTGDTMPRPVTTTRRRAMAECEI
jgi:hypothetical protein